MGDKTDPNTTKIIHPVYIVANIQNKVRILDGKKVTYSSWVKLFKLHARGYKVLSHIDGTTPPAKTDEDYESWSEIDAIVLQWIYGTLSDDLLTRVLEPDSTAYEAWTRIQNIFLNNKGSRAAALEHEFNNLTLRAMPSLEDYCQILKELADQLNDVDCPVNERRLVLQLVRGLPTEYDPVGAYVNQTLPPWETACSMLQLEHQRQHARDSLSPAEVAAAVTHEPSNPPPNYPNRRDTSAPNRRQPQRRHSTHRPGNPTSNQRHASSSNRRGSQPNPPRSQWPNTSQIPYWAAAPWWTTPPCPYPTMPRWASPWNSPQNRQPNNQTSNA